jgi:hypothetical protein
MWVGGDSRTIGREREAPLLNGKSGEEKEMVKEKMMRKKAMVWR